MKIRLITTLLTLFATPLAHAARPHVTAPTVTLVPGQPVKATWPGGYEAELRFERSEAMEEIFFLQAKTNSCASKTGNTVKLRISYRLVTVGWYWTQHPIPARIDNVLYAEYSNGNVDVLESFEAIANTTGTRFPDLTSDLPPDSLTFTDTDWLPGMSSGTLAPFTIDSWLSENMIRNSQTGLIENRITGSVYGLRLQPGTDPLAGDIVHMDSAWGAPPFSIENALFGTTVSWILNRSAGACQIDFKMISANTPNSTTAHRASTQGPYIWKQDSLIDFVGPDLVGKRLNYVDLR